MPGGGAGRRRRRAWRLLGGGAAHRPYHADAVFVDRAQDLARGKRSEIDHLNGFVLRQGEALGVPTPVNRVLHTLVKLIETSEAKAPPTSTR